MTQDTPTTGTDKMEKGKGQQPSSSSTSTSPSKSKKRARDTEDPVGNATKKEEQLEEKEKESTKKAKTTKTKSKSKSKDETAKKSKDETAENTTTGSGSEFTNTKMPESFDFVTPHNSANSIKILSYNVNSLPASLKKNLLPYLKAESPDILCLQETKLNAPDTSTFPKNEYPYQYWSCSLSKKGYAGSAVLSKIEPVSVHYGIKNEMVNGAKDDEALEDDEGRCITLEFADYFLVACYVPNAGMKLERLDYKEKYNKAMEKYLNALDARKPVVWAGDLNVAHHEIDLARPKQNKNKTPGFTDVEREGFTSILNGGSEGKHKRVDVFRQLYPNDAGYTYFSYRFQCRPKHLGWRLDYFVVSEKFMSRVVDMNVRKQCYGASDHLPLYLVIQKK